MLQTTLAARARNRSPGHLGPDYDPTVANEIQALLDAGREALDEGDWEAAKSSFEQALAIEETGEALYGLGTAHYWLADTELF